MKKPILAICYDFDKTLSPDDMQAQGFIQSIGHEVSKFWEKSNSLAKDNGMDQNLAYMYSMLQEARGRLLFKKETLQTYGAKIQLFPGVETWFKRIKNYANKKGVEVEHYIISSGLKEMIEGTTIAKEFKRIYASSFYYDEKDVAIWPAQAVNYTNKTQFLFRIQKGTFDVNDQKVNAYFEPQSYRIPFRNIVYIGDSDTDIPCMKLVHSNGGHSIGVYNATTKDKSKVFQMLAEGRIKYFKPADYTKDSPLETLIKQIIDRTATNEILEQAHFDCLAEKLKETQNQSPKEQEKKVLINDLGTSRSFANTHDIIKELSKFSSWDKDQVEQLLKIALTNSQVKYILSDKDLKVFYSEILKQSTSDQAAKVKALLYPAP